jgi:hypothetical protein
MFYSNLFKYNKMIFIYQNHSILYLFFYILMMKYFLNLKKMIKINIISKIFINPYYYQFNDCKIKLNYILFIILYRFIFLF